MRKKPVKYLIGLAILLVLGYNSVYFKKLDLVKKEGEQGQFNAPGFTNRLWKEQMPRVMKGAIEIKTLDSLLQANPKTAIAKYSNSLSIGNYRYFMVRTMGTVDSVNEDDVVIDLPASRGNIKATIATEFIYGNAIRDASKLIKVEDFTNSKDLNDISEAFNQIARKEVITVFKKDVKKGQVVELVGAIEMNKEHVRLDGIEIIPVQLKIIK